jgi:translocator protein
MYKNSGRKLFMKIAGLIFWLGICYLTAWVGAQVSPGIGPSEWYESLQKPAWNPPAWLFGPVWTTLYTMMGFAAWTVWKKHGFTGASLALTFFVIQLVLNGAWSWIFFGAQSPGWAFVEILILLAVIGITTYMFMEKSKAAGWLMVPYILWVSFATVLTGTIWWMN